ncbi:MAG TPA: hypothetical protein VFR58_11135 [Flavisolibacter sp.]|nr:hypothetical protein [Flavisolibacter sp.]
MKEKKQDSQSNKNKTESTGADSSDTPIYLNSGSTLQTPEEAARDKQSDPRMDDSMEPSNDDLHITKADRMAGSDRAGTSERKE